MGVRERNDKGNSDDKRLRAEETGPDAAASSLMLLREDSRPRGRVRDPAAQKAETNMLINMCSEPTARQNLGEWRMFFLLRIICCC